MQILRSVQGRNINGYSQAWQRGRNGFMALLTLLGTSLYAQTDAPQGPPPGTLQDQPAAAPVKLSAEDLSQLLAPIALYPDALIALILPAATVPSDVVMGARYVQGNGDPNQVDGQPWDDSVKSLVRYPDVLQWMDKNLDWTDSVGEAFVNQPADVMDAIQQLRAQAKAKGNLTDTPQQKVVQEDQDIRIVPANPEVIYVPQYDPQVVYVQQYDPGIQPFLSFGLGYAVGSWLNYDFDWGHRHFYHGNWNNNGWNNNNWNNNDGNWHHNGGGGNNVNVVNITNVNQWQPSAASQQQITRRARNNTGNVRFVNTAGAANRAATVNTQGMNNVEHRHQLPRPTNFTTVNRGGAQNTATQVNGTVNTHRGTTDVQNTTVNSVDTNRHVTTPPVTAGEVNHHRTSGTATETHWNENHHATAPVTTAPQVTGQLGNPAAVSEQTNHHVHGDAAAAHAVNTAPAVQVDNSASVSGQANHHGHDGEAAAAHAVNTAPAVQSATSENHHAPRTDAPTTAPAPLNHPVETAHPQSTTGDHHHDSSATTESARHHREPASNTPSEAPRHLDASAASTQERHPASEAQAQKPSNASRPEKSSHNQSSTAAASKPAQAAQHPAGKAPDKKSDKKKDKNNS